VVSHQVPLLQLTVFRSAVYRCLKINSVLFGKSMNRYEGKPLVRLLECYVLAAIDQLDDEQRDALQRMAPKLAAVYRRPGTWSEIIRDEMGFPESLPTKIREIWEHNLAMLRERGVAVDPNEFAMAFVDQNFPEAAASGYYELHN
jgi:hypothetical protein